METNKVKRFDNRTEGSFRRTSSNKDSKQPRNYARADIEFPNILYQSELDFKS